MERIVVAMGWQKGQKNMDVEDLKQIWNSIDVVAITVATIAAAIQEH